MIIDDTPDDPPESIDPTAEPATKQNKK